MEAKFLWFSGVEVDHMIVLYFPAGCKIIDIFWGNVAFISDIEKFEEVDEVEIIVLC